MIKPLLSKINFAFGRNPEIEQRKNWRSFIPEPYMAVVLISADFELAWAWQYAKNSQNPLRNALIKARQERENMPKIISLCEQYNIPITWATVGHLFLEYCKRNNDIAHPELPRLNHFENAFWRFHGMDWFENDPCTDYQSDPEWYCPDLIRLVLDSSVKHEIGCHTFSHIDCRDEVCKPELLKAELRRCKQEAERLGIEIKSFVHPGHTIGNLDTIVSEGFTNFRTDYRNVLGYPKKHKNGLWQFEQTAEFVYRKGWSVEYHIYRYKEILKRAIKSNSLCVFWFHPSFDEKMLNEIIPQVFDFINSNSNTLWVTTHKAYIDYLEIKNAQYKN